MGLMGALCLAGAAAADALHETRSQKIAELTADLGYGDDLKHLDAAIALLAADVAPGDPEWNPTHPRWPAVRGVIKTDLHDDADRIFGETEVAIREGALQALEVGVVGDDLDFALAFFRSGTGGHFRDLQFALTDLSIQISLERQTAASGDAVDNLDVRRRIVELWLPIVFIRSVYPPQTAERTIDTAYEQFSKLRGPQVDALAKRFADDLPQFTNFVHSASFGRIIEAEKLASQRAPAPNLTAFLTAEERRHAAAWHAAYLAP